ncbi:EAL domain-containing protein [Hahella sp. KA22]|uniref:putative bifunctional diguanylate cyclase/phosphodiesterase n=1 Tax=Hahella sp. KA22 TaxID=1628392 RepID=UPI000FDF30B3|nr:EAL domain-containing protein [Hahella sp. KA22]AZZ94877.1 EAL domain-containing protein [Hahella sp. KA22]QAY58250.1 EAL domain-containing protein [Hahella sp. KA22]
MDKLHQATKSSTLSKDSSIKLGSHAKPHFLLVAQAETATVASTPKKPAGVDSKSDAGALASALLRGDENDSSYPPNKPITVLLIEKCAADARRILDILHADSKYPFHIIWTHAPPASLKHKYSNTDVILLDASLLIHRGVKALAQLQGIAPRIPILIMCATPKEQQAAETLVKPEVRQRIDFFAKNHVDAYWLPRALMLLVARLAAENLLAKGEKRAQQILNSIGDAVLATDLQGNVIYLNKMAESLTGWSYKDALGQPSSMVLTLINDQPQSNAADPIRQVIENNCILRMAEDCILVRRDGVELFIDDSIAPIHDGDDIVSGAVIVFHDVSAERTMAKEMSHMAQHDALTGLPNRALLEERFSSAVNQAKRNAKQIAILFIDLDFFKLVNDSLGHGVGDQLLRSVAERLVACVRATDTVSRHGGDEFVILLSELDKPEDAAHVAEKLTAAFCAPHLINDHKLHVSLSIGISVYPDDGSEMAFIMQNADIAMYHAKKSGRNSYQFFRADMNARASKRLLLESKLRQALKEGEFILHYQPQVELISGEITGAEALIRWRDPGGGLIPPAQFIPIAEECGLIISIGRWVLNEACRQMKAWRDSGCRSTPISVNISALEFRNKGFLDSINDILAQYQLPAGLLKLELTESILMHDIKSSINVLDELKSIGVLLSIDDFGTGYSSLSYLQRLPIDTLKIDQSFVRDLTTEKDDATIVSAVIGMGKNLGQKVIAEGVETLEQLNILRSYLCDEGQGFQFSRPLSANDYARFLATNNGVLPLG